MSFMRVAGTFSVDSMNWAQVSMLMLMFR